MTIPYAKRDPQTELRILFYSLLRTGLAGSIGVWEYIPWDVEPPHVALGDARGVEDGTKDFYTDIYELHIEVVTLYGGTMENVGIVSDIKELLTQAIIDAKMCFGASSRFALIDVDLPETTTEAVKDNQFEQSTILTRSTIKQLR